MFEAFPRYTDFDPAVPVWCLTPNLEGCWHRFFDTSPISPSGRYLAVTRMQTQDRLPAPDEPAEVVIVDLESGETKVVAETRGWDTQLGAQVQWGATDGELFFNDTDTKTWRAHGVKMDVATGARAVVAGPVYMVSPDGKYAASPCLLRTALTQPGYGIVAPPVAIPHNTPIADDDGLYITDIAAGTVRLISLKEMAHALDEPGVAPGAFYCFHAKWNPQGTRLMLVVRWRPRDTRRPTPRLLTMRPDGSDVHLALPANVWGRGGHHPNWCPDGERIIMNLKLDEKTLRFVTFRYDGSGLSALTEAVEGSGHPTLHPDGHHVITDVYQHGTLAIGDGTIPIRWVDTGSGTETHLARICTRPAYASPQGALRVDPHPAWDRSFRYVAFNAWHDGSRRVFVADMGPLL